MLIYIELRKPLHMLASKMHITDMQCRISFIAEGRNNTVQVQGGESIEQEQYCPPNAQADFGNAMFPISVTLSGAMGLKNDVIVNWENNSTSFVVMPLDLYPSHEDRY